MVPHPLVRRTASVVLVATLSLAIAPVAVAAKVYRCGNTFQDLPCAEAKPSETRPAERAPTPRDGVECAPAAKEANGRGDRVDCLAPRIAGNSARDAARASTPPTK